MRPPANQFREFISKNEEGVSIYVRYDPNVVFAIIPGEPARDKSNQYSDTVFSRGGAALEIHADSESVTIAPCLGGIVLPSEDGDIPEFQFDTCNMLGPEIDLMLTALHDPKLQDGDLALAPITSKPSVEKFGRTERHIFDSVLIPRAQLEMLYEAVHGRPFNATANMGSVYDLDSDGTHYDGAGAGPA